MKLLLVIVGLFLLPLLAFADQKGGTSAILPQQFAGWQQSGAPKLSTDPAVADPTNAALLKEYGFTDFESATYTRDDGRKLTIKAARFGDASGAYGAFTYYRSPEMLKEEIGNQGASLNERVLFYRGNVLIDAVFQALSAMSASELRELAGDVPLPAGSAQNLATFLSYVPHGSSEKGTAKYVVGPVGLDKIGSPLSPSLVDFGTGAEVALGTYGSSNGDAKMMLISYPTPQVAGAHLRAIEATQNGQPGNPAFYTKRTGPMVVLVAGVSRGDAQSLLASVNYDANVTWNERNPFDKRNNIGNIVWNALLLCGILIVLMLVAGVAFGGVRVALSRFFANKHAAQGEDVEFISLHLEEAPKPAPHPGVKSLN